MENPVQSCVEKDTYDQLMTFIRKECHALFGNFNFCNDASNMLLMKTLQSDEQQSFDEAELRALLPKLIEDLFNDYRKTAFAMCYAKTHDSELAGDLAQEAVYQLLAAKSEIRNVNFWLKQVTHNLLCVHYRHKKEQHALSQSLISEEAVIRDVLQNNLPSAIEGLNPEQTQEILNSKEYKIYLKTIEHDSLEDFAAAAGISYEAAKKRRAKALRNLRSRMLLLMGWEGSPEILNFNQYHAILKFIRKLSAIASGDEVAEDAKLVKVLQGFDDIVDWGISQKAPGKFNLLIVSVPDTGIPQLATIFLKINKRNHIIIEGSKRNKMMGVIDDADDIRIPIEKGRVALSLAEIESMVRPFRDSDRE